jgi:hypothetical protein
MSTADQRRSVDATIASRWTGLFPAKGGHGGSRPTVEEKNRATMDRWLSSQANHLTIEGTCRHD